jgi:hypothetical protein
LNRQFLIPAVVASALAVSCNCDTKTTNCGTCPQGTICLDGGCQAGCNSDLDCTPGLACVGQKCLKLACLSDVDCGPGLVCLNHACAVTDAGTSDGGCPGGRLCGEQCVPLTSCCTSADCPDAGACVNNVCAPPGDGGADAGSDGGSVDAGPCQPSCGPSNCGASDHCGGTCAACCYQCQAMAGACGYDVQLADDAGACPAGHDAGQPPCAPCWSCGASDAYCVTPSCCGTYTIDGTFGVACSFGTCNEKGYAQDVYDACVNAQSNTLASSSSGVCIWPSGQNTSPCGFQGYLGDPHWYDGGTAGGCDCFLSCGGTTGACCVAKNFPASSAAQCCSGQLGACPGTGNNCCQ